MRVSPSYNNLNDIVANLLNASHKEESFIICNKDYTVLSSQINEKFRDLHIINGDIKPGSNIIAALHQEEYNDFLFYSSKALKGENVSITKCVSAKDSSKVKLLFQPYLENHFIKGFILITYPTIDLEEITKSATLPSVDDFLNDSDLKFKTIFEQASVGIMIFSLEGDKLIINDKFCNLLGYTREEIVKDNFWNLTHEEDLDESKRMLSLLINEDIPSYFIEKRYTHKNGKSIWVQGNCSLIKVQSRPTYIIAVLQDITGKKDIEFQLKEKEITFRSLFENAPLGMVQVDLNLKWMSINDKFCETIGYTQEELQYLSTKIITFPDDYLADLISVDKLIRGTQPSYTRDKRYIHKKGYIVWVSVTVTLFRDSLNNPLYFISIIQDISAKKKAEQDLLFKNNELDTFLYRASHDLKGPVASLLGICNLAPFEVKDKNALLYFKWVQDRALRMHTIITSLAEIGKIKDHDPERELIDFDELIKTALSYHESLPQLELIELKIINSTQHKFYSDKSILSIIFNNLIENAIKFHAPQKKSLIVIEVEDMDSGVRILITDNGIGIPEEIEDKIYNMFFRGTEQSDGSGLGLYIAKNAIDKLNGSINLINRNSGLTVFSIYLPTIATF